MERFNRVKTQGSSPSPSSVPTRVASPRPGAEPGFLYPVSVVAVILLSYAARVYHLGAAAIEFDEAFSIHTAASSLADILNAVANYEPHPPFYYSFLHFWYPVFGASEFSLRFPSLLTNVLTVALLIRLAASLGWRWPGVLAGLIFACNPYQIWYAQEARMYAPVILFGLLAVYGELQTARHRRRRDLVGYVAFMLLALYTHYYAIFLGVFVNLLVLATLWFDEEAAPEVRQSLVRRWLAAQLVVALLYLPWLVYAYRVSLDYSRAEIDLPGMLNIVKISLVEFSVGLSYPPSLANSAALAFLVLLAVGLWGVGRSGAPWPVWRRYLLVVGYLLMPLALGGVASLSRSMFQTRYFLVSAPAFFILLGLGSYQISRVSLPVGIAATLLILGIQVQSLNYYFFDPRYDKSEPADAIERVAGLVGPRDGVILDGWGQANQFWYYHDLRKSEPAPGWVLPLPGANAWSATLAQVDQIMATRSGVWLLTYSASEVDGQRLIEGYLSHNYFPVLSRHIITNDISYFAAAPATAPRVTPIGDTCNDNVQLDAVEDYGTSGPAGAILPITVHWRATEPITHDYGVSWRLLDSAGHTVLQRDTQPASGFSPTTTWPVGQEVLDRYGLLVPSDLPPGTYDLAVIAFDRSSGAECVFRHGQSALPGPTVPLLSIKVLDGSPARTFDQPAPSHPVAQTFGALTLDGYDLDPGPFRPGDPLAPRLYWRVNQPVATDEVATVRLLDANGAVIDERSDKLGPPTFRPVVGKAGARSPTTLTSRSRRAPRPEPIN